jgi:hypothetical protein
MSMSINRRLFLAAGLAGVLGGCQRRNQGDMVVDSRTDRMYGMRSDATLFTDPALYPNRRLKLTLRNMSGDPVWDLDATREQLYQGYVDKGYERSDGIDFGLKLDLNVIRSQQYDRDMMAQFGFLGAAAGLAAGTAAGAVVGGTPGALSGAGFGMSNGASLGTLAGYFTADNIYVVVTEVVLGIRRNATKPRRVVTFDGSPRIEEWDEGTQGFTRVHRITLANYGGGRNITQLEIADDIRKRQMRSLISVI